MKPIPTVHSKHKKKIKDIGQKKATIPIVKKIEEAAIHTLPTALYKVLFQNTIVPHFLVKL